MLISLNNMKGKLFLLSVLAVPVLMTSCSRSPESTGIEYAPEMYHTIALEPFTQIQDSIAPFGNKMNAQASVPGTIPRGGWADYQFAENDSAGPISNPNPLPATDEVLAQGEVLYTRYCGICHGKTGAGDGKVSEKDEINPPSFLTGKWKDYTPGQFYHVIMYGKNIMGSYASQLTFEERWKVIHYISKLQGKTAGAATPADSAGVHVNDSVAPPPAPEAPAKPAAKPHGKPGNH